MSKNSSNVSLIIKNITAAKTDNEKLACLLLIPKSIDVGSCNEDEMHELFEATGFSFIKRLLKSKNDADNLEFQCLAFNILSCFCSDAKQVSDPDMIACLHEVRNIIDSLSNIDADTSTLKLWTDCFDFLCKLFSSPAGQYAAIESNVVTSIARLTKLSKTFYNNSHNLIISLISQNHREIWSRCGYDILKTILSELTTEYVESIDEEKFIICSKITDYLSSITYSDYQAIKSEWNTSLQSSILIDICCKLGVMQRHKLLELIACFCEFENVEWVLHLGNSKKLLLIANLACVEMQMILDHTCLNTLLVTPCTSTLHRTLCKCFGIVEIIISYLVSAYNINFNEEISVLYNSMSGAFSSVINFLSAIDESHPFMLMSPIVIASSRALGAWIAEETMALKKEVIHLITFLFHLCEKSFQNLSLESHMSKLSVNEGHSTNEKKIDVISFILPGLCHLSVEEEAIKKLFDVGFTELLRDYLIFKFESYKTNNYNSEEEDTLNTIYGVFLNLTVMKKCSITSHSVFLDVLNHSMKNVSILEMNNNCLVLKFNMIASGLMILRYLPSCEFEGNLMQFLKISLNCLQSVHCIKDVKSHISLIHDVLPHWENIQELWLLGMQAFSSLLSISILPAALIFSQSSMTLHIINILNNNADHFMDQSELRMYAAMLEESVKYISDAKLHLKKLDFNMIKKYKLFNSDFFCSL